MMGIVYSLKTCASTGVQSLAHMCNYSKSAKVMMSSIRNPLGSMALHFPAPAYRTRNRSAGFHEHARCCKSRRLRTSNLRELHSIACMLSKRYASNYLGRLVGGQRKEDWLPP